MNKLFTTIALATGLMGCSTLNSSFTTGVVDIAVTLDSSKSNVTITKKVDKTTGEITFSGAESAGSAIFSFRSRPGSMAGYIEGYRVTSDIIRGAETIDRTKPREERFSNVYVQSGWRCTPVPAKNQSCGAVDKNPGDGIESDQILIGFAAGIAGLVQANQESIARVTTLTFFGHDATGRPFDLETRVVNTQGVFQGTK